MDDSVRRRALEARMREEQEWAVRHGFAGEEGPGDRLRIPGTSRGERPEVTLYPVVSAVRFRLILQYLL